MKKKSQIEETLALHIRGTQLPQPEREYRFHQTRRWRFDFAWPELKVAVETEGGTWVNGRHNRGSGFEKDCEKYNNAAALGWHVFRFTSRQVQSGAAIDLLLDVITGRLAA